MRLWNRHPSSASISLICAASIAAVLGGPQRAAALNAATFGVTTLTMPRRADSTTQRVTGVVRNFDTDAPIANVHVLAVGTTDSAVTSSDGRYTITLAVGSHPLRFTHPEYQSFTVVALVGEGGSPIVDVSLTPLPTQLPGVHVNTTHIAHVRTDSLPGAIPRKQITIDGGQLWSQAAIRAAPQLDQSDLFRLLGTAPTTAAQSESPSSLHLLGGAADQNLLLLDGVPIENAIHAGWLTSAIDPAAIETMTLYADHTPARFGGRLSGVVDLQTRGTTDRADMRHELDTQTTHVQTTHTQGTDTTHVRVAHEPTLSGTVGSNDIAVFATGENSATGASGLLSLRHSSRTLNELWPGRNTSESNFLRNTGWFDGLARGSVPVAGGSLSALAFQSHDVLHFNDAVSPFAIGTGFEWISSAFGSTWAKALDTLDHNVLTLRGWQSNTETHGAWSAYTGYLTVMTNTLTQSGASADIHTTSEHMEMHNGLTMERFRTTYIVTPYVASIQNIISTNPTSLLSLPGQLTATSAYTDIRWSLSNWAIVLPGARITYRNLIGRNEWQFEPRMGVTLAPTPPVTLSAYYDRTSQPLQSLRNEENVFDGTVGLNLLSAQNDQVPMATATTFSGVMTAELGPGLTATMGMYNRRLNNIVIAPPQAAVPFVSDSITSGRGSAKGWYATFTQTTPRFVVEGNFRLMVNRFSAAHAYEEYQPGFASVRYGSLAFGWHADQWIDFHTMLVAVGGRRAARTDELFSADSNNQNGTAQNGSGSAAISDPGGVKLPPYMTLNLGMSRALSLPHNNGDGIEVRMFAAVDNVFNRINTIGVLGDSYSPSSRIPYRPRTWTAGLDWQW